MTHEHPGRCASSSTSNGEARKGPMQIYASTTDQVLLAVLWAVRATKPNVSEDDLTDIYISFQRATGQILYGSSLRPDDRQAVRTDLDADLASLMERGLIARTPNPHAEITLLGSPAASALLLTKPLQALVRLAQSHLEASVR